MAGTDAVAWRSVAAAVAAAAAGRGTIAAVAAAAGGGPYAGDSRGAGHSDGRRGTGQRRRGEGGQVRGPAGTGSGGTAQAACVLAEGVSRASWAALAGAGAAAVSRWPQTSANARDSRRGRRRRCT